MPLLEAKAAGEDNFFVWVTERRLDLAWWWMALMVASTNPTVPATIHALLVLELILEMKVSEV
ncbi:hypothetical protein HanXRQr2_Chr17g0791271 [Helianthus annuus]|uniref:Uncharacterized protein n=1 Tax=Helianthus annuus TaxID=4232 RepID=A0A9K3DGA4_HELAN|nr:hypothetical protein HanXRQr2_Chr17g0791271 [Helianthus annuus]KAJ0812192.1 hypothetical protein HanPSC8_Chr17g0759171 [Helianthus annuus]